MTNEIQVASEGFVMRMAIERGIKVEDCRSSKPGVHCKQHSEDRIHMAYVALQLRYSRPNPIMT